MKRAPARQVLWLILACLWWGDGLPAFAQDDVPEVVRRLLEEGNRHLGRDRVDEAVEVFEEARRLGPSTVQVYLDLGAAQVRQGDLAASQETFEAGLRVAPGHRGLLYNAAVVRLRSGDPEKALEHVSAAIADHGEEVDLLMVQAGSLARLERDEEALGALRRAEKLQPRSARIQFSLGNRLHSLGRLEDAVRAFEKAAELDRDLNRALYNLGAVLIELGRFPEARKAYEKALEPFDRALRSGEKIDPIHAVAYGNLGAAYSQSQDWRKALEAYSTAAEIDPDLADAHLNMGYAHYRLESWKKAARAYEKAVELDPDLSPAYIQLGEIHHQAGDCDLAVTWFRRGLPRLQANERLRAMEGMARCYTEQGKVEEAEQVFRQALAEAPADPQMLRDFGSVLRQRGRLDEAKEALSESLRLRPNDLPTLLEALAVEEQRADRSAQMELLERILKDHGDRPELWPARKNYGSLLLAEARWELAADQWATLAATPDLPEAEKNRAQTLAALSAWVIGKAERNEMSSAGLPTLQAIRDAEAGDLDSALRLLAGAEPSPGLGLFRGLLLWIQGQDEEALASLRRAEQGGAREIGLQIALGSLEVKDVSSLDDGIRRLEPAVRTCLESPVDRPMAEVSEGRVWVRPPVSPELCELARATLNGALLQSGVLSLPRSPQTALRRVRSISEDAGLTQGQQALAAFVEGTALLSRGSNHEAVEALKRAAVAEQSASRRAAATNNLGLAYSRLGRFAEAKKAFAEARSDSLDAVLNLGILVHEQDRDPQAALKLYQEYVRGGGPRRSEVQSWIDRLLELYP